MKKKSIIITILMIILLICANIRISYVLYENNKSNKLQKKRHEEIKESVKEAVERNIRVQYPGCRISNDFKKTDFPSSVYNSYFLVQNGYINKSELLDVDNESYCDVYIDINPYYENALDHQNNCEIYYKIYLKCKNYEDKGYIDLN